MADQEVRNDQTPKNRASVEAPVLAAQYEPPVLLDLETFTTVTGSCITGGGSLTRSSS